MTAAEIEALEAKIQGLRDLMATNFQHIQERLTDVRTALENLAVTAVTEQQYRALERRTDDIEERVQRLEKPMPVIKVAGSVLIAIIIAVLVALATGKAHIEWH